MVMVLPASTNAQSIDNLTNKLDSAPPFLVCVIAGVLLAFGFMIILTTASIASGISFIGDLENKNKPSSTEAKSDNLDNDHSSSMPMGIIITSGIGIWTVLTASISLFFASLLAVKLSLVSSNAIGITLGLIIWATFMMAMMYLEIKSVTSIVGGVFKTAFNGIKYAFTTTGKALSKSPEARMKNIAKSTISTLTSEIAESFDDTKIRRQMNEYINRLTPKEMDYSKIRKELSQILGDINFHEEKSLLGFDKTKFLTLAEKHHHLSKRNIKKLAKIFMEVYAVYKIAGGYNKVAAAVDKITGNTDNAHGFKEKFESYLRSTGSPELNPESLKEDIEKIVHDPKSSLDVIKSRFNQMDKYTLMSVLSQRKDISEEDAKRIAEKVENAIEFVKTKVFRMREHNGQDDADSSEVSKPGKLETKLSQYLASLERPEFDYEKIKLDLQEIFHDPKSSLPVIKNRLKQYDKDSFMALLTSTDKFTKEDAEKVSHKIDEAKNTILKKAESIQIETKRRIEEAKTFAIHEAEMVRKTAASAAWWLLATAVISGVASALGGIFALSAS